MTQDLHESLKNLIAAELFLTEILHIAPFSVPEPLTHVPLAEAEILAERCRRVLDALHAEFGDDLEQRKIRLLRDHFAAAQLVFLRLHSAARLLNLGPTPLLQFVSAFGWPRDPAPAQSPESPLPPLENPPADLPASLAAANLLARHSLSRSLNLLDSAAAAHPQSPEPLVLAARLARLYGAPHAALRYDRLLFSRFNLHPDHLPSPNSSLPSPPAFNPPPDHDPEVMRGRLQPITFFDVLQICATLRFTAELSFSAPNLSAAVRFTDGLLVDAELAAPQLARGLLALKRLTRLLDDNPAAAFALRLASRPFEPAILTSSTEALLMNLATELDQSRTAPGETFPHAF